MNRSSTQRSGDQRRSAPGKLYRAPVLWIAVLLAGWLAITEWPAVASSMFSLTH